MYTMDFDRAWVDKLTTIDVALQVYHKDKFLDMKRRIIPEFEFDEEAQTKVWEDYHDLLHKAVFGMFEIKDIERLERYRRLEGQVEVLGTLSSLAGGTKLYFRTNLTRDDSGKIIKVTFDLFDNEINKRLSLIHI